ncbi:MAG: esterase-like activity of phytase family protein [Neomegalonema sp.]|nr:esterase-like activity of phytase family protein [Neomegalonema sp.]
MTHTIVKGALIAGAALLTAGSATAETFKRIESFEVIKNLPKGTDKKTESSPEIIAATADGKTLVYTDSPLKALGFIDIADPKNAKPLGTLALKGEPTSVAIAGGMALVGVNTSESFVKPSGFLAAIDLKSRKTVASCDLGGQPDSVATAPDGSFVAIAIENERDEDLKDGVIPQLPAGYVAIIPLNDGKPNCAGLIKADVTGLAKIAPSDPEPEFVAINSKGEIAVTLQENNHIVILDKSGKVLSHFSAGAVDLKGVDLKRERAITFTGEKKGVLREPDAVKWLDDDRLVIANEGDYNGGSRGFTIFAKDGKVLFESGMQLEHAAALAGHYPEKRSSKKGVEPEGLEVGEFDGQKYIFVLLERSSLVGVYRDTGGKPEFVQLLPSGVGPEGAVAIPSRGLFVTANEVDLIEDKGPRAHVMIYALGKDAPTYPSIVSTLDKAGLPIGWGALSGLAAHPTDAGKLYAVNDSFYAMQPSIFEIDATAKPAKIIRRIPVTRGGAPAQLLDLEGVYADKKGGFWLSSEGRTDRLVPHALYYVNAKGEIKKQIPFPAELLAVEKRFGAEGITMVGDTLWIAIQREWKDDPKGQVKLVSYNTKTKEWGAVRYPLEKKGKGWIGLSEITAHGDYVYIIERDNQIDSRAVVKRLYRVKLADMKAAKLGGELPLVKKELVHDFLPELKAPKGYVVDKIEGFAIDAAGVAFAVTDNDGVDDSSGETHFFSIGKIK